MHSGTRVRPGRSRNLSRHSRTLAQTSADWLELNDRIADADETTDQDVSVDAGAMGQLLDDPRPGHLLEMTTRLTELNAEALNLANAKALTYKGVDIHITHGQLPSSITGP